MKFVIERRSTSCGVAVLDEEEVRLLPGMLKQKTDFCMVPILEIPEISSTFPARFVSCRLT
jgi:hypothetical protein